ncbi:cell shape-determining protein MreB [Micromonospora sp. R77]|uniref:cell shape-determining protein MreB n=1 Tax=Micromonospora sp. R77 TaxID=2925836 RepID=UPI001F6065D7|nr:cell shape-determining protein MreB [Micromonospora sp. R77]MCI4066818.1 cell shape-determining protein MreB [Micromonospora sp. R77]
MPVPVPPAPAPARTGLRVGRSHSTRPPAGLGPEVIAVDVGSAQLRLWLGPGGVLSVPVNDGLRTPVVQRGRVVDGPACVTQLRRLISDRRARLPVGALAVACRPVLAGRADQETLRQVLTAVLAPSRLLFVDSVRASAIGAGASAGTLLLADLGAQLSEVALLADGRLLAARRAEVGTRDLHRTVTTEMLAESVVRLVRDLRQEPALRPRSPPPWVAVW